MIPTPNEELFIVLFEAGDWQGPFFDVWQAQDDADKAGRPYRIYRYSGPVESFAGGGAA